MVIRSIFLSGIFFLAWIHIASAQEILRLKELPLGDRWFSVLMNNERVGFARGSTARTPDGYEFSGDGSEKMAGMFARESVVREKYYTDNELSLKNFTFLQTLNGVVSKTDGEMTPSGLKIHYESKGEVKEKILKQKGPIYPPTALNLYPLMRGVTPGKSYRLVIVEPEDKKLKKVRITIVGVENDSGKRLVHLTHNRYPFETDVWIDTAGNTFKESVRDGWIVTSSEDEASALRNLAEAAVAKKDFINGFSRIPAETGLERAKDLKKLVIELSGLPASFHPTTNSFQTFRNTSEDTMVFTTEKPSGGGNVLPKGSETLNQYVGTSGPIQPQDPGIVERMTSIAAGESDPHRLIEKLVGWVSKNLQETQADTLPPQETLRKGSGNCQSHVLVYVSLARSAGIPTKYVSGLVYIPEQGFVYHSWAESYTDRWISVDPTLGQVPADLTHITLVEGYSQDSQSVLGKIVGNLRARILEQIY